MDRLKQIAETLKRLKGIDENEGFKEIEEFLLNKEETNYYLNEVENDNWITTKEVSLKKYILKNAGSSEFISPNKLQKDKRLYKELSGLILDNLGTDYVLITMIGNQNHYRNNDEMEYFNLVFKKAFAAQKTGNIKIVDSEKCFKLISFGSYEMINESNCMIGIDYVAKNNLVYMGPPFENKNILFYGFNIEENPFLIKLFENHSPKKILNIIPISNLHSYHDNVD